MNTRELAELAVREMEPTSFASLEASKLCTKEEIVYGRNALTRRLDRMTEIVGRHIGDAILAHTIEQRIGVTHRRAFVCKTCECVYADDKVTSCDCMGPPKFYVGEISYRKMSQKDPTICDKPCPECGRPMHVHDGTYRCHCGVITSLTP